MRMLRFTLPLLLLAVVVGAEKVELKTYTETAANARLVVVHAGATWCAPCMKMLPDWHAFENKYRGKITLVHINADQQETTEWKQYGPLIEKEGGLPITFWLDSKGKVVHKVSGALNQEQLVSKTEAQLTMLK